MKPTFLPRAAVALLAAWFSATPVDTAAAPAAGTLDLGAAHRGTPAIDNALLAQSRPSDAVAGFFRAARLAFESNPRARFAELPELAAAADAAGLRLTGGPMLGARTESGVAVWVRTARPAGVAVVVETPGGSRRFGPVASTPASDLTAVVSVTGLLPDVRYPYRLMVDDEAVPVPDGTAIPAVRAPDAHGPTRILFGADFHKTGLWNNFLLEKMRGRGAAAAILLGDLAADDRNDLVGLHRSDYLLRDLSPAWRAFAASTPVHAIWDDHDYFDNDLSGIPPGFNAADRATVRAVWHENWINPGRDLSRTDRGLHFRTRIGPCDVIMLDTRSQRGRRGEPDCFLGKEQMAWLETEIAACTGPFVILTSGTMWSDNISHGKDSWGVWDPEGRERVFSWIEKKRLAVLLLSGDRHGARVIRIPRRSGFHFWEFELGSLGGHPGPPATGKDKSTQLFGLAETPLFGEFAFHTSGCENIVNASVFDSQGLGKFAVTLTQAELTPPERPAAAGK